MSQVCSWQHNILVSCPLPTRSVDRQTDSKEPHHLYPSQDMHGRLQFPGCFVGMWSTVQFASQERNKGKVQNIFVISPHSTSPNVIALFTILLYHLLLPSCAIVKFGEEEVTGGLHLENVGLINETCSLTLREERRLRVFENRVLRRVFGPKRDEVQGNGENYIMKSSVICTPY